MLEVGRLFDSLEYRKRRVWVNSSAKTSNPCQTYAHRPIARLRPGWRPLSQTSLPKRQDVSVVTFHLSECVFVRWTTFAKERLSVGGANQKFRDHLMTLRIWVEILNQSVTYWNEDNAPRLGASLAFYTILSMSPLMILVVAAASLVFSRSGAQDQLLARVQATAGTEGREAVRTMLTSGQPSESSRFYSVRRVCLASCELPST
jgi:hypothetical protein